MEDIDSEDYNFNWKKEKKWLRISKTPGVSCIGFRNVEQRYRFGVNLNKQSNYFFVC